MTGGFFSGSFRFIFIGSMSYIHIHKIFLMSEVVVEINLVCNFHPTVSLGAIWSKRKSVLEVTPCIKCQDDAEKRGRKGTSAEVRLEHHG